MLNCVNVAGLYNVEIYSKTGFHIGEDVKWKVIGLYFILSPTEGRDSHSSQSRGNPYLSEAPSFLRECQQKIILLLDMIHSGHTVRSNSAWGPTVNLRAGDRLNKVCFFQPPDHGLLASMIKKQVQVITKLLFPIGTFTCAPDKSWSGVLFHIWKSYCEFRSYDILRKPRSVALYGYSLWVKTIPGAEMVRNKTGQQADDQKPGQSFTRVCQHINKQGFYIQWKQDSKRAQEA